MTQKKNENAGSAKETLVRLGGEYAMKGMIVLTACIMVLLAVVAFLIQGFIGKQLVSIEQVIIIAGIGYTAAKETYFRTAKKGSS
jgi:hypothetical protein